MSAWIYLIYTSLGEYGERKKQFDINTWKK